MDPLTILADEIELQRLGSGSLWRAYLAVESELLDLRRDIRDVSAVLAASRAVKKGEAQ